MTGKARGTFTETLHGPYLDLRQFSAGPVHAERIDLAWDAWIERDAKPSPMQRIMPLSFRNSVCVQSGRLELRAERPSDVLEAFRTSRWQKLCDACERPASGDILYEMSLAQLLMSLGFFKQARDRLPKPSDDEVAWDDMFAQVALMRATCGYVLALDGVEQFNILDFKKIAETARVSSFARINAGIHVIVQLARQHDLIDDLKFWCGKVKRDVDVFDASGFEMELTLSRYYRASAFLPFLSGDRLELVRQMDLAEDHANSVPKAINRKQEVARRENFLPLLETRSKEAYFLNDVPSALSRLNRLVDADPYDARSWLELGEAQVKSGDFTSAFNSYCRSIMLGPPATAIAHFMAGQCAEQLGLKDSANLHYIASLNLDHCGVSPSQKLGRLSGVNDAILSRWALQ